MGSEYPNHLISTDSLSCKEIKNILMVRKASNVKVAVLSFQNTLPGHAPFLKIADWPQFTNEVLEFMKVIQDVMTGLSTKCPNAPLLIYSTNDVSLECHNQRQS